MWLAVSLGTASAVAGTVQSPEPFMYTDPNTGQVLCGVTIDISGVTSYDFQGAAINDIIQVTLGAAVPIVAIRWDLNLTTVGTSWAEEATIGFENQSFVAPAFGDSFSVSNMNYNSGGPIYFADNGQPDVIISSDGIIDIEFFETGFDDNPGAADAFYGPNSRLWIYTSGWPTPGSVSTLAFAGLICGRRRR